ncbi:RHS repeat-associated core domain-containing protein [Pseudomonas sp. JR33AA]|uniref:RHS repeat-associated core domain-containing protein n=1 Tax=Pseudomonas sp. JR33AA TaxID=2899113 RepID=UPI001F249DF5|nr:RHS repeat-associated core domain-containing protein [Pseudomonas sp. JR33AA]MCE5975477.1 RHS repeat-associated core domain-containing protein [Pseudomonas sp. JR33AA]
MSKLTNKSDRGLTQSKCIPHSFLTYSPYGHSTSLTSLALIRYNSEYWNRELQMYHLGLGHRQYKPSLMRFISPDRLSPFERGGINAYSYCSGDPINYSDLSGRTKLFRTDPSGRAGLFHRKIQTPVSHIAVGPSKIGEMFRTRYKNEPSIILKERPILQTISPYLDGLSMQNLEDAYPSLRRDLSVFSSTKAKALIKHDAAILEYRATGVTDLTGYDLVDLEALLNYKSNLLTRDQALALFDLKIHEVRQGYRFDIWASRRHTYRFHNENSTTQD